MFDKLGNNARKYNIYKDGPSLIFHRRKPSYEYNPEKCIEEQPTFTFENDRNIKLYRNYIENQSKTIDRYSQLYVDYMKKSDNKINTPFNQNHLSLNLGNNNNYQNNNTLSKSQSFSPNSIKDNYVMKGRTTEITNPEKFFQNENQNYLKFKEEQKRYLDFNYNMMLNRKKQLLVNPFNKGSSLSELGKSFLSNNPILNPFPNYSNKYFGQDVNNYVKINVNNNNNNNNNNMNNFYYDNNNSLRQAGNNLINGN